MKEKLESSSVSEGPSTLWRQKVAKEEWVSTFMGDDPRDPERITENQEIMEGRIRGLGELMKDADFWWQLDGGMNISAKKGEFFRVHGDIDISLMEEDLEKAEKYLAERGYGFFFYYRNDSEGEDGSRSFRRVGATGLLGEMRFTHEEETRPKLGERIAAFDRETGKIRNDAGLVAADLSLVGRSSTGEYIGRMGTVLPDEWMHGTRESFKGVELNLSYPARFMFNKIFFSRFYDEGDIKEYAAMGVLTLHDVDEIERVAADCFEKEGAFAGGESAEKRERIAKRIAYAKDMLVKLREWVTKAQH